MDNAEAEDVGAVLKRIHTEAVEILRRYEEAAVCQEELKNDAIKVHRVL